MLVECKECHKEVSDSAPVCPHCGIKLKGGDKGRTVAIIFFALFVIVFSLSVYRTSYVEGCSKGDYVYFSLTDGTKNWEGTITDIGLTDFTIKTSSVYSNYITIPRSTVVLMQKSTRTH